MKEFLTIIIGCLIILPNLIQAQNKQSAIPEAYYAEWSRIRPSLDANIEKYRKGDASIEIVDENGVPIKNATLTIRQTSHDFIFGCNSLVLGQLGDLNDKYEREFAKLFNLATTTFCLGAYCSEPGKYRFGSNAKDVWRRPVPDNVVEFGKKYGIRLKGQPLLADSWFPEWGKDMSADQVHSLYSSFFKEVANRYADNFYMFDLVNESLCTVDRNKRRGWNFPLYTSDLDYVGWAFKTANSIFTNKPPFLTINEATPHIYGNVAKGENAYYNQLKELFEDSTGKLIDGIGFQFHLYEKGIKDHLDLTMFTPSSLLDTYNAFSVYDRPLYVTEITIPSTFTDGPEGEKVQAEVVANLYRMWFSIESMAGITWWNLCDGAAHGGAKGEGRVLGGLLDEDMLEKPAYQALYQLIQREWKTNLITQTNLQGKADFRGFYGKYDITVIVGEKSQTFEVDLLKGNSKINRITFE